MAQTSQSETGIVAGRVAVGEVLQSTLPAKIYVQRGARRGSILPLIAAARARKVPVEDAPKEKLDKLAGGVSHQGIVAVVSPVAFVTVDEILARANDRGEMPFLVIADRIADPHNFGALLRCCEGAGVHGVIFPRHDACPVNATVMKTSAGAAGHVPLCQVTNLSATIDALKKSGLWVCAVESGGEDYAAFDFRLPLALIFGSEQAGVSRLVREKSDFLISLPMKGKLNSLNVSCAAAVVLYAAEAARRKRP